jgi:hypothetical protein
MGCTVRISRQLFIDNELPKRTQVKAENCFAKSESESSSTEILPLLAL